MGISTPDRLVPDQSAGLSTVFINGRFLTQTITGVQRYALEVVRALDQLLTSGEVALSGYKFVVLAPPAAREFPALSRIEVRTVGWLGGHLWEQLELPLHARSGLLVSLANTGPALRRYQMITIHDAAVVSMPLGYSLSFRMLYAVLLPILGRVARRILTVSNFSKRELVERLGIASGKLRVVPEGCEHILSAKSDASIFSRFKLQRGGYVLAVSSLNPNKNFSLVVKAVEMLGENGPCFVVAGGADPRVFAVPGKGLPSGAVHVGYISDGELRALYEEAICMVYPSLYEGFGLPPLEAMACGCPVIVSREASLPEICGDAALYCDARDPCDLAARIEEMVCSESLRRELKTKGLAQAARYSWRRASLEWLGQIEEVLASRATTRTDLPT